MRPFIMALRATRVSSSGRTIAFHAMNVGSIPSTRSSLFRPAPGFQEDFVASTPSPFSCVVKPDLRRRFATSLGTSRPVVSLFGVPV
jgi:hypothetical protein